MYGPRPQAECIQDRRQSFFRYGPTKAGKSHFSSLNLLTSNFWLTTDTARAIAFIVGFANDACSNNKKAFKRQSSTEHEN